MGTMDQGTPPEDGSVTTISLADDAVTDAKMATQVSTKITGLPTQTQDLDMGEQHISNSTGFDTVPADPFLKGFVTDNTNLISPRGSYVLGDYVFIASSSSNSLVTVDISDQANPEIISTLSDSDKLAGAHGVFVVGNLAYVACDSGSSLTVVDVSNKSDPKVVGTVVSATEMANAYHVYVSRKYAYVTGNGSASMAVVDISEPTDPKIVGSYIDTTNMIAPHGIHVVDDLVYVVAQTSSSLTIIDVTDKTNPVLKGRKIDATNFGGCADIDISGMHAFITGFSTDSLAILDISDPTTPFTLSGTLFDSTNMNEPFGLEVLGKHAYIAAFASQSLVIVDISTVTAPVITSSVVSAATMGGAHSAVLSGKYAFVTGQSVNSLAIIDVNGIDASAAHIGSLETDNLSVTGNETVSNNLYAGGLNAGTSGIHSDSDVSVSGNITAISKEEQLRLSFNADNYTSFTTDISTIEGASYNDVLFSFTDEDPTPRSVAFNSTKTKMYMLGGGNDAVFQYTLGTAGDPSTAIYDGDTTGKFSISTETSSPQGIVITSDDTRMYIVENATDFVLQYTLSTNIADASYDGDTVGRFTISEEPNPTGITLNTDDTKMYVCGVGNSSVYQYTLGTNIADASYDTVSFSTSSEDSSPQDISFDTDGTKIYVVGGTTDSVYQYSQTTGFILSSTTYDGSVLDLSDQDSQPTGIVFNEDDNKMYISGVTNDSVYQYTLGTDGLTIAPTANQTNIIGNLTVDGGNILQNPGTPFLAGTVVDATNLLRAQALYIVEKYAYMVSQDADTLSIIDVSTPSTPEIISIFTDGNMVTPTDVMVIDTLAYVTCGVSDSLLIVDISDPTNPILKGALVDSTNLNGARNIQIFGKYAYITATAGDSLTIVDISDPTTPVVTGTFTDALLDGPKELFVDGNYAYVTSESGNSLLIVDISDPTTPTLTGSLTDNTDLIFPRGIDVVGRYAYVVTLLDTLYIIDVSDPANPTKVSSLTDATDLDTPFGVKITGNYAYVNCVSGDSITIVDISDPENPTVLTSFSDSTNLNAPRGMFISGKYAYTANFSGNSLSIFDLLGTTIATANIGSIETNCLSVLNYAIINRLTTDGINVGLHGIHSDGDISTSKGAISVLGGNVVEVFTEADLGTVTAGVNIVPASNTTYILMAPITQTLPIDITTATSVQYLTTNRILNTLTYTNTTDTQFRGTDITALYFFDLVLKGNGTGTLFDINGGFISCKFPDFENYSDLGTVQNLSDFFCPGTLFELITSGLKFINCTSLTIIDGIILSFTGADINAFEVSGVNSGQLQFYDNILESDAFANFIRIDADFSSSTHVNIKGNSVVNSSADLFDITGGTTGTYTAVADNSISATAVTSVTTNGGIAVFTHAGTSPLLGSTVTTSTFSETTYNVTGVVSLTTATTFEIQVSGVDVAFVATDTGSYLMNGITITSTAHGLSFGNSLTLSSDLSTEYDGGGVIYNIQTNSFDFAETFIATQTGTWDTSGIDQSDNRVLVNDNPGKDSSETIAEGVTNANTTATTITDGTYAAIDVSIHIIITDERFKLIDATAAIWELTSNEPFNGKLTGNLSGIKTGSTGTYRIAMSTNGVVPTFATANYVPMEVKTDTVGTPLEFSVILDTGDTIQIMMAGDGTSDNITVTDLKTGIQ